MFPCKAGADENTARKLPRNVTFRDYVALLGNEGASDSHQRKKIRTEVTRDLESPGPCGKINGFLTLSVDGVPFKWHYLQPAALVNRLCKARPAMGNLIQGNGGPSVAIYMDEMKPGNVLRPDPGRSIACFYWTFLNLPPWYHCRQDGWFFFACFPTKLVGKLQGGFTFLFAKMLEVFYTNDPWNFGCGIPCSCANGTFVLKAPFKLLLCDEKAMSAMWSLRGASGTKPCVKCQNVVGHMTAEQVEEANVGWIVHYSCADRHLFAPNTTELLLAMRHKLQAAPNKKECNRLGQLYGLQFSPFCPLWHPVLGPQLCPIQQTSFDWMHVLVASGGVAQYELNEFLKSLQSTGISLQVLNDFASLMVVPKSRQALPRNFFLDRLNMEDNSPMKTFSSEVLTAVPIVVLFCDTVLQPCSVLPDHCQSMRHLGDILDIVTQQGKALLMLNFLEESIDKHGVLFKKLYAGCCKLKFHWLYHIPENFRQFQANMSCFAPERKHRATKTVAAHVLNDHLCEHTADRMGQEILADFQDTDTILCPIHLLGVKREIPEGPQLLAFWSSDIMVVHTSKKMMSETGVISLGDMLLDLEQGELVAPIFFLEVTLTTGAKKFLAQVSIYQWKKECLFDRTDAEYLLEWHSGLKPVIYTKRSCGSIQVCLGSFDQKALRLARGH